MTSVAIRLKAIRRHFGLNTRAQMAERLHLPASTYSGYETDAGPPKVEWLAELARMGVDINWLLLGTGTLLRDGGSRTDPQTAGEVDEILLAAMIHTVERRERGGAKPLNAQEKGQLVARLYSLTVEHAMTEIPAPEERGSEISSQIE